MPSVARDGRNPKGFFREKQSIPEHGTEVPQVLDATEKYDPFEAALTNAH